MPASSLYLLFSASRRWFVKRDRSFDHREWSLDVSLASLDLVEEAPVVHLFLFHDETGHRYAELGCRGSMPVREFVDRALGQEFAAGAEESGVCVPTSVLDAYPDLADHLVARGIAILPPAPGFRSVVRAVREWEADVMWPLVDRSFEQAAPLVPGAAAAANAALKKDRGGRVPHISIAIANVLRQGPN